MQQREWRSTHFLDGTRPKVGMIRRVPWLLLFSRDQGIFLLLLAHCILARIRDNGAADRLPRFSPFLALSTVPKQFVSLGGSAHFNCASRASSLWKQQSSRRRFRLQDRTLRHSNIHRPTGLSTAFIRIATRTKDTEPLLRDLRYTLHPTLYLLYFFAHADPCFCKCS